MTSPEQAWAVKVVFVFRFPYSIEMVTDQKRRLKKKIMANRISLYPNTVRSLSDRLLPVNTSEGGGEESRNDSAPGSVEGDGIGGDH